MADQQQAPGLLANILAVAGFIILIVIIVWGAYQLLRLTGSGVSSLFSRFDGNEITVSAPTSPVQSGRAFNVSWQHAPEEAGSYAFLYQCKAGFRFDVGSGSSVQAIPCGNAFTVGENKSLSVTPVLSGADSVQVPISVVFMPTATSSEERPQGTATLTVVTTSGAPTASGSTSTPSNGSQNTQPTQNGTPDLAVNILAIGVIDPISGAFVSRLPMNSNEIAAVKFDIKNQGGGATGEYYFTVHLPMYPSYSYTSPAQASLAAGAHVESTLRFRPVVSGGGTISVVADSTKAVSESNENNNGMSVWMSSPNYPYQYQQPYVY